MAEYLTETFMLQLCRMNIEQTDSLRRVLIAKIEQAINPFLEKTGWLNHDGSPVWAYMFGKDHKNEYVMYPLLFASERDEQVMGFTSDGVITDVFMAIAVADFNYLGIKDLLDIHRFVRQYKF